MDRAIYSWFVKGTLYSSPISAKMKFCVSEYKDHASDSPPALVDVDSEKVYNASGSKMLRW